MKIATRLINANDAKTLKQVLHALHRGELVAFPTDTVYGLGTLIYDQKAIDRIFLAKKRSPIKAIAVLLGSLDQLRLVTTGLGEGAMRLAQKFWPGALTLVVPRHPDLPSNLSPDQTIGLRMPNHPFALALLLHVGPMAVTSANLSGGPNPRNAQEVLEQLQGRVKLVVDGGETPGGIPSTVVDCTGAIPVVLREGAISKGQILKAAGIHTD